MTGPGVCWFPYPDFCSLFLLGSLLHSIFSFSSIPWAVIKPFSVTVMQALCLTLKLPGRANPVPAAVLGMGCGDRTRLSHAAGCTGTHDNPLGRQSGTESALMPGCPLPLLGPGL